MNAACQCTNDFPNLIRHDLSCHTSEAYSCSLNENLPDRYPQCSSEISVVLIFFINLVDGFRIEGLNWKKNGSLGMGLFSN